MHADGQEHIVVGREAWEWSGMHADAQEHTVVGRDAWRWPGMHNHGQGCLTVVGDTLQ